MDAVDPDLVDAAEAPCVASRASRVRGLRLRWIGHRLRAEADLDVDPATLHDAHLIAHDAEHRLTHAVPKLDTVLIHAYPAHHETPDEGAAPWHSGRKLVGDHGHGDESGGPARFSDPTRR